MIFNDIYSQCIKKKKINKKKGKKIQPQSQIMRVLISAEMLIWEDTSKLHLVQKQWLSSPAFSQPASELAYFIAHQSEEMFIRSSNLSVCTDEAAIVPADLNLE